jgi:hypothetical protein
MNNKPLDLNLIQKLKNTPTKKRNEEKIKQIWKRFLRKIFDDFKLIDDKISEKIDLFKSENFKNDKWKRFYYYIFRDLIIKDPHKYPLDLIMDICTEKTVGYVKERVSNVLTENSNWKTLSKVAAMKKVPASFRYLITQSSDYKTKFLEYLDKNTNQGIISFMTKIIKNKLKKMFVQWEQLLCSNKNDWDKFLSVIKKQISNPKFKLPWLLSDIQNAVEYCKSDILSEKLKKEFTDLQLKHYSRLNN